MCTFTETNAVVSGLPMTIIRLSEVSSMAVLNCSSSESPWMYGMVSPSSLSPYAVTGRSLSLSSGIISSSSLYARFSCLFLLRLCINIYCVTLGNVARVYPWIVQGLTFYICIKIYITIILARVVQVDAFLL